MASEKRINSLDALRGLAALSVCWFHLVHFNAYIPEGPLRASGSLGWLGVEVFFVISGFVIPFALHRSGYRVGDYGTFLLKRLLRLTPPYYATIAFVIALGYGSMKVPGFKGELFHVGAAQIGQHLTYSVDLFGGHWLNYVFWTLAIELQYYLLIGLAFPWVASANPWLRGAALASMGAAAFLLPAGAFVFRYLFVFGLGVLAFQHQASLLSRKRFLLLLAVGGCGVLLTLGPAEALASVATAGLITFGFFGGKVLQWLGDISYSLYLLHMPIYPKVFSVVLRVVPGPAGIALAIVVSLSLILAASYALFRLVEQPAQKWSSAVRYRRRRAVA